MKRLAKFHNVFRFLFILFLVHLTSTLLIGCAGLPAWLSDAQSILPLAEASITAILGIVTALSGKTLSAGQTETLQTVFHDINSAMSDVNAAVKEYQSNPGTGTVQNIESAAKIVVAKLQQFLGDVNITDSATQQKIVTLATVVLQEFEAWASLIPTLSAKAGARMELTVPMAKDDFKQHFNLLLHATTGNQDVDQASASAHGI